MITVYSSKNRELVGLSTDEKPTNVGENMLFLELDTGNFYYFDGTAWSEIGSSGGGSGDDITITLNVVGNEPSYSKQFRLIGMPLSGEDYITGLFQIDGHYTIQAEPFVAVSESPISVRARIIENSVSCLIGNDGDEPISLDGSITKAYNEEMEGWVCTITGDCTITAQGIR